MNQKGTYTVKSLEERIVRLQEEVLRLQSVLEQISLLKEAVEVLKRIESEEENKPFGDHLIEILGYSSSEILHLKLLISELIRKLEFVVLDDIIRHLKKVFSEKVTSSLTQQLLRELQSEKKIECSNSGLYYLIGVTTKLHIAPIDKTVKVKISVLKVQITDSLKGHANISKESIFSRMYLTHPTLTQDSINYVLKRLVATNKVVVNDGKYSLADKLGKTQRTSLTGASKLIKETLFEQIQTKGQAVLLDVKTTLSNIPEKRIRNIFYILQKDGVLESTGRGTYKLVEGQEIPRQYRVITQEQKTVTPLEIKTPEELKKVYIPQINTETVEDKLPKALIVEGHVLVPGTFKTEVEEDIVEENDNWNELPFFYRTGEKVLLKDDIKVLDETYVTDDDILDFPLDAAEQFGKIDRHASGSSSLTIKLNRSGQEFLVYPHWVRLVNRETK